MLKYQALLNVEILCISFIAFEHCLLFKKVVMDQRDLKNEKKVDQIPLKMKKKKGRNN